MRPDSFFGSLFWEVIFPIVASVTMVGGATWLFCWMWNATH